MIRKSGRNSDGTFAEGNPGKPKGARHRSTQAALTLLNGEAEALTRKVIELALAGDVTALRLTLERIVPPCKDAPVVFALSPMATAGDAASAMASVLDEVASGNLTPSEGAAIAGLIEQFRKTIEVADLEARLTVLETSRARI